MISVLPIKAFGDNYIWVIKNDNGDTIFFDPGCADSVIKVIEDQNLNPLAAFITHHHNDHTGGISALKEKYKTIIFGPAHETGHETEMELDVILEENDCIEITQLDISLTTIDTPGHTKGHICFHSEDSLFSGDTLFSGGCGRVFEGTPEQMYESLQKLCHLPDDTLIYCAHEYTLANLAFAQHIEPDNCDIATFITHCESLLNLGKPTLPVTLGQEKKINPFLRCDQKSVKKTAENHAGSPLNSDADVFAVIREMKNNF
ncbi:MAG: hydroxyacylglutathione hydrolase [Gammaproteobacteria bacterium]|nr:MAG: hydroxyacylglutathione hydrolase [Gammaproteobacteria bacterium]